MNFSKKLSSLLVFFMASMILFSSCKKDIDAETNNPPVVPGEKYPIPAATPVTGSVSGLIVNENNQAVDAATVSIGSNTTTTDARGNFSLNNITLDKYITTLTVTKTGYFKAYRSFSANNARNFVSIKLIPKAVTGNISSSTGGNVDLPNGTQLTFQANSIKVKSTGAAYTGNVKVYTAYIDPTRSDISTMVPGSFMAQDASNLYTLQSAGMIAVDLESDAGEALQLVTDKPATIKMPIPASLLSKAPNSIDTWSLNDKGIWQKEGTATRSGNNYEMQASHFSFWNLDVPMNAIYLTLHVQDQNGNPVINSMVQLSVPNTTTWWSTTYGFTDNQGNVSGFVPAAIGIEMSVFPNPYTCNSPIGTQTIGPFSANTNLTVTVNLTAAQQLMVSGTATDCSNGPLANGIAYIYFGTNSYIVANVVNGSYSTSIIHCGNITEVSVTIIDSSNNSSIASSGPVAVSGNAVTIPDINVCGGVQPAVYSVGSPNGACVSNPLPIMYTAGIPLGFTDVVAITVTVTSLGSYQIGTTSVNGITYTASGIFTSLGAQSVVLNGSGTPLNVGVFTISIPGSGGLGCSFNITVSPNQTSNAVFNLADPITCSSPAVSGSYIAGVPMDSVSNYIAITLNVLTGGNYNITSAPLNGIIFSASGFFPSPGTYTVLVHATGTPAASGGFGFVLQSPNSSTNSCTVVIPVSNPSGSATFTFAGSGGACAGATVAGTYSAGIPLIGQNTLALNVNVTTAGPYQISTNVVNGMGFVGTGTFSVTGNQIVLLTAQGTPVNSGIYTFTPGAGTTSSCSIDVIVN